MSHKHHPHRHHHHRVFVPGRVCMLGEHSDWSSSYRSKEHTHIHPGACIAYNTDCGIELEGEVLLVPRTSPFLAGQTLQNQTAPNTFLFYEFLEEKQQNDERNQKKVVPFQLEALTQNAKKEGDFFAHVCATAAEMLERFGQEEITRRLRENAVRHTDDENEREENDVVTLLKISCTSMSLPMKKGLSSSAALAVAIAKLIGKLSSNSEESLTTNELMDIAYFGERRTGSQCGRLDQVVAHGPSAFVKLGFEFDERSATNRQTCDPIQVSHPFYFVVCDLNAGKDTKVILRDLNSAFPTATDDVDAAVHEALGPQNLRLIREAEAALSSGNAENLGKIFSEAQRVFDKKIAPKCPKELMAPVLHRVLENEEVRKNSLGGKGVGSQGDGSAQFVCANAEQQEELCRILKENLSCTPMKFMLKP